MNKGPDPRHWIIQGTADHTYTKKYLVLNLKLLLLYFRIETTL